MNFQFKKPDMVAEAAKTGGKNVFVEILMFLGVFLVAQILVAIPINIVTTPMLLGSEEYMAAALAMDYEKVAEITTEIVMTDKVLITNLFSTVLMIITAMLFCKWIQKRKMTTLGYKKPGMWKEYGIGMLVGFGMMAGIVLISALTGALKLQFNSEMATGSSLALLAAVFVGFLIQGMSEEVLCRGYFLVSLARKDGKVWMGIIVSSVAFGALHLGNAGLSVLALINLVLFGIFAGVYFVKRGNIWGVAAIHSIWNFAQGNIFGILVSGNDFGVTVFESTINEKMPLINGGAFGLEGGIVTTIVLVVATVVMLQTKQKDIAVEEVPEMVEAAQAV